MRLHGRWYCGPECFELAAQDEFLRLRPALENGQKKTHRLPIGLLLLSRGKINDAQLKQALTMQREKGTGKIGKFLQEIQAASPLQTVIQEADVEPILRDLFQGSFAVKDPFEPELVVLETRKHFFEDKEVLIIILDDEQTDRVNRH